MILNTWTVSLRFLAAMVCLMTSSRNPWKCTRLPKSTLELFTCSVITVSWSSDRTRLQGRDAASARSCVTVLLVCVNGGNSLSKEKFERETRSLRSSKERRRLTPGPVHTFQHRSDAVLMCSTLDSRMYDTLGHCLLVTECWPRQLGHRDVVAVESFQLWSLPQLEHLSLLLQWLLTWPKRLQLKQRIGFGMYWRTLKIG